MDRLPLSFELTGSEDLVAELHAARARMRSENPKKTLRRRGTKSECVTNPARRADNTCSVDPAPLMATFVSGAPCGNPCRSPRIARRAHPGLLTLHEKREVDGDFPQHVERRARQCEERKGLATVAQPGERHDGTNAAQPRGTACRGAPRAGEGTVYAARCESKDHPYYQCSRFFNSKNGARINGREVDER